jgi:hypothetical protein
MANCFLCIMMTGMFLAAGVQAQEAAPAATPPSVADAARAARERRESMTPKRTMTDDDIATKRGAPDSANMGASAQRVRAELEKRHPPSLTNADPDILLLIPSDGREVALNDSGRLQPQFLRIMITPVSSGQ